MAVVFLDNNLIAIYRGVAQFGRALRSGRRGRGFESRHLDHISTMVLLRDHRAFFMFENSCGIRIFKAIIYKVSFIVAEIVPFSKRSLLIILTN